MQPELIIFLLMVGSFMLQLFRVQALRGHRYGDCGDRGRVGWKEWAFLSRSLSKERLRSWTRSWS